MPKIVDDIKVEKTQLWLPKEQRESPLMGYQVIQLLETNNLVRRCVRAPELKDIQTEGPDFFLEHFFGKMVFGLGIYPESSPFLAINQSGKLEFGWHWSGYRRGVNQPVLLKPHFI